MGSSGKDLQPPLSAGLSDRVDSIRIIINPGRGMGHQKAAITAMHKLREMGFKGFFDIRYEEETSFLAQHGPIVDRLKILIPGYEPTNIDGPNNVWTNASHADLGAINITRLPAVRRGRPISQVYNLPRSDLTISAGGAGKLSGIACEAYNTEAFISLQPTDWPEQRYVAFEKMAVTLLGDDIRLSAHAETALQEWKPATSVESNIQRICEIKSLNTQLVYGLYSPSEDECDSKILSPTGECKNLISAHRILQKEEKKPVVLFFPQAICQDPNFQNEMNFYFKNIIFLDLTKQTEKDFNFNDLPSDAVVIAYTGNLSHQMFNQLMMNKTTYPPVIEGCNSRNECEANGKPFLHAGSDRFNIYEIDEKYSDQQRTHIEASVCLRSKDAEIMPLVGYLRGAKTEPYISYHNQRQKGFLARPDACEVSLNIWRSKLSIRLNNTKMLLGELIKEIKKSTTSIIKKELFSLCDARIKKATNHKEIEKIFKQIIAIALQRTKNSLSIFHKAATGDNLKKILSSDKFYKLRELYFGMASAICYRDLRSFILGSNDESAFNAEKCESNFANIRKELQEDALESKEKVIPPGPSLSK
jgi:hypothetical protein